MQALQEGHSSTVELLLKFPLAFASEHGDTDAVRDMIHNGSQVDTSDLKGWTSLMYSSCKGHTDIVRLLLDNGASVNTVSQQGETSLLLASEHGHSDIVRVLLQRGAKVNVCTPNGRTALIHASLKGHTETVRVLLESGAEVDVREVGGWTTLMVASDKGETDIVRLLLEAGAKVNLSDKANGRTALIQASQNGYTDLVRLLLKAGAEVNLPAHNGATALMLASETGHVDTVKLLLESGANVDLAEQEGTTSLIIASQNGHTDIVRLLLQTGADVNVLTEVGRTGLIMASLNGHTDTVRVLLEAGAEVNLSTQDGRTALIGASMEDHTDVVRLLLETGAEVNLPAHDGTTSLMIASHKGYTDTVKVLLESGAEVDPTSQPYGSSLIFASQNGHTDITRLLLETGAEVNLCGHNGRTALIQAAWCGHTDAVRVLLKFGANVDLAAKEGVTSLHIASQYGHTDVVRLLLEAGAEVNLATQDGRTALLMASVQGHTNIVRVLLETGADVNLATDDSKRSLILASENGHTDIVKLLLEAGTEVNLYGQRGITALTEASHQGHTDTVRVLLESGAKVDVADMIQHDTAVITAARNAHWNTIRVLVERGADVFKTNDHKENAVIYLAFGIYQDKWACVFLEKIFHSTTFDALVTNDYGICIASVMLVGALLHNMPVSNSFVDVFSKMRSASIDILQRCLYGYLPEGFHHAIQSGSDSVFAPYQGVEGKISLHTLGTAIVCKLPISALHWLTPQHRDYLTNMLGQTPLHLLAMENHQLTDMEERIVVIVEQLGFSFSDRDNNGRLAYHIACMWGNDQFLQYAEHLDPEIRTHLSAEDHLGEVCLNYRYSILNTVCYTVGTPLMGNYIIQHPINTNPAQHNKYAGFSSLFESHFSKHMQLQELQSLMEPLREISVVEKDIVSLFTDTDKGIVNLGSRQHQYWILTVIELLEIIGREMGKIDLLFECEPEVKGSVQEYTKCGALDELDVSMKLVNMDKNVEIKLHSPPEDTHSLTARLTNLSERIWRRFRCFNTSSLEFCTTFWSVFTESLRRKRVVKFLNRTGLVIENYKKKHGFVAMLNVSCKVNRNMHQISIDLAPCVESDQLYGYTALLRHRYYNNKLENPANIPCFELSSSKLDWAFLKYVPLEVLCGYTLVKLLRSLAHTFQAEDGRVYTAEDILPSYMLKTALLWVLDPEDKFEKVYFELSKEGILQNEVTRSYSADVHQLCSILRHHSIDYNTQIDSFLQETASTNTNVFLLPYIQAVFHAMSQDPAFQIHTYLVNLWDELQQYLKENKMKLLHNKAAGIYGLKIIRVLVRIDNIQRDAMQCDKALQSEKTRLVKLVQEFLQICQSPRTNCEHQQHEPVENCPEKEHSKLKKMDTIVGKCVSNPDSLSVEERILPYVLVTQCRELRVQNGIDLTQIREEVYGGSLLNPDTAEIGQDETIYSREFYTQAEVENITQASIDQTSYPDCEQLQGESNENYQEKEESMLKNLGVIHDKCVSNPGSLSVKERILPYVLVTQCRELRVQNGIDLTLMREEVYGGSLLNPDTAEIGQDETIYSREFYTQAEVENITHTDVDHIIYPDITEETARKCRVWAIRILRLLPHLLQYREREGDGNFSPPLAYRESRGDHKTGVVNYYLPAQLVYPKDKALTIGLCQALGALLQ